MAIKQPGSQNDESEQRDAGGPKVGSDRAADQVVGGKLDFGIPADRVRAPLPDGGRDKGPESGTGYTRSGSRAIRDVGVGHAEGPPSAGSGGDLDPDVIGLDGRGGVSADPPSGRTQGPDITEGGSAPFASGPPAAHERNQRRPGTHGAAEPVHGSTVDRSGGDASTTGPATGADAAGSVRYRSSVRPDDGGAAAGAQAGDNAVPDNAAAGEISSGEAGGQDNR